MNQTTEMAYWIQVFTPSTWRRFLERGANTTGFRETRWNLIQKIRPGDKIICYLSGVSRLIAVLEVLSDPFLDTARIWDEDVFPCRIEVAVIAAVPEAHAIPIRDLSDLSIFKIRNWSLYLVSSPSKWNPEDGRKVVAALKSRAMEQN